MMNNAFSKYCRVCLVTSKKLRSLYHPIDEGDEPPYKMLHLITGVQVEEIDEHVALPKNICKNCELSLNMAFEFRVKALKSQQIIKDFLKKLCMNEEQNANEIYESNDKYEYAKVNVEELDECQSNADEGITEDNLENLNDEMENSALINDEEEECEEQENTSYLIDEYQENETESYSDQQDELKYEEPQNIEEHCEENYEQLEEALDTEDQHYIMDQANDSSKFSQKMLTVLKKNEKPQVEKTHTRYNMKQIPRRGRKPANENQIGYICDICGNIYSKRGRMTEHRQRHDKELKFNCEVCSEKFHTRELLRKHMFSHSGGKPYKCGYCSRTFYYESVRKAHENVHKGHKPYVCDVCGKAFGYAHALQKHKLIHAEIKLYRCAYCNKDFRLQHHMKQHELTKLHQNAVRLAKGGSINIVNDNWSEEYDNSRKNENILLIEAVAENQLASGS